MISPLLVTSAIPVYQYLYQYPVYLYLCSTCASRFGECDLPAAGHPSYSIPVYQYRYLFQYICTYTSIPVPISVYQYTSTYVPVPGGLVMVISPLLVTSAMGKPRFSKWGTLCQSVWFPPVTCANICLLVCYSLMIHDRHSDCVAPV